MNYTAPIFDKYIPNNLANYQIHQFLQLYFTEIGDAR